MIITEPFNTKKMEKFLDKWYRKNHQVLTFDTYEVRTTDSCGYDVCLWDPKKKESVQFMFTISNYSFMTECTWRPPWGTIVHKREIIKTFDAVTAASMPFYFDRHFFIRTWSPLKTADIERCARFFLDHVLDLRFRIWNIRVEDHPEIDMKLELEKAEKANLEEK